MRIKLPQIDRKAALLAGFEIGPNPEIEIAITDFGEDRAAVIMALSVHSDGSATLCLPVAAPTAAAIVEAVRHAANEAARKAAEKEQKLAELRASLAEATAQIEVMQPEPKPGAILHERIQSVDDPNIVFKGRPIGEYTAFVEPRYPSFSHEIWRWKDELQNSPEYQAYQAACAALKDRVKTADDAAQDAVYNDLLAANDQQRKKDAERDRIASEERQRRLAETAVKRLETGYWEKETDSYNFRRYGKPWCARVTGVDARGKPVYEWAEWTGRLGESGLLRVACRPGEIIAWGQRDNRNAAHSEHKILKMQDDGLMEEITVVAAAKHLRRY